MEMFLPLGKENQKKTSLLKSFESGPNTLSLTEIEGIHKRIPLWAGEGEESITAYFIRLVSLDFLKEPCNVKVGLFGIDTAYGISQSDYKKRSEAEVIAEAKKVAFCEWSKLKERKTIIDDVFSNLQDGQLLEKINGFYNPSKDQGGFSSSHSIFTFEEQNLLPAYQEEHDRVWNDMVNASRRIETLEKLLKDIKADPDIKEMNTEVLCQAISIYKSISQQPIPYNIRDDVFAKERKENFKKLIAPRILGVIFGRQLSQAERKYWVSEIHSLDLKDYMPH